MASAAQAQEETAPQNARSTSTRAEVVADLKAWKAAGMDEVWRNENTPDVEHPAYREVHERYVQAIGKDDAKLAQHSSDAVLR